MKIKKVTIAKIIGNTAKSIENWEKQDRPILKLLEKYFTEEDLKEFIITGNIKRLDNNEVSNETIVLHKDVMVDSAVYSAKEKSKNFWGEVWYKKRFGIKNNIKNIVSEIKLNNEKFTIGNSKKLLVKYTKTEEVKQGYTYTNAKKELISDFFNNELAEIEAYAMIVHSDKIFK